MRNFSNTPSRADSQEKEARFGGYGDRVGSGVELAPSHWKGGEVVTDPELVAKVLTGIRPKKMFYSPIGDGVVAADGVELKRGPVDLTPKVEVIHQRIVEKGSPGQAGVRVTEKAWTEAGPHAALDQHAQLQAANQPAASPPPAKPEAAPFAGLPDLAPAAAPSPQYPAAAAAPSPQYPAAVPASQPASQPASNYNSLASRPEPYAPYGTLGSQRSSAPYDTLNSKPDPYAGSRAGSVLDYPTSGRASRASTTADLFSEPGYRYEIKKDYQVTNPKELIHQFATTTAINTIPGYERELESTRLIKQSYSSTTEETFGPYPPYAAGPHSVNPNKFVKQLRDETMTVTQRQANQNLEPLNAKDAQYSQRIDQIRRQAQTTSPNADIDQLTERLVSGLHTGRF